jgi:hypothetical protein
MADKFLSATATSSKPKEEDNSDHAKKSKSSSKQQKKDQGLRVDRINSQTESQFADDEIDANDEEIAVTLSSRKKKANGDDTGANQQQQHIQGNQGHHKKSKGAVKERDIEAIAKAAKGQGGNFLTISRLKQGLIILIQNINDEKHCRQEWRQE